MTEITQRETNFRKDAGDVLIRKYFNKKYINYKNDILLEIKGRLNMMNINENNQHVFYKNFFDDVKKETRKEKLKKINDIQNE